MDSPSFALAPTFGRFEERFGRLETVVFDLLEQSRAQRADGSQPYELAPGSHESRAEPASKVETAAKRSRTRTKTPKTLAYEAADRDKLLDGTDDGREDGHDDEYKGDDGDDAKGDDEDGDGGGCEEGYGEGVNGRRTGAAGRRTPGIISEATAETLRAPLGISQGRKTEIRNPETPKTRARTTFWVVNLTAKRGRLLGAGTLRFSGPRGLGGCPFVASRTILSSFPFAPRQPHHSPSATPISSPLLKARGSLKVYATFQVQCANGLAKITTRIIFLAFLRPPSVINGTAPTFFTRLSSPGARFCWISREAHKNRPREAFSGRLLLLARRYPPSDAGEIAFSAATASNSRPRTPSFERKAEIQAD